MRKYGGLYYHFHVQYISILIGSLALIGIPYLTGFYSKDIIPEILLVNGNIISYWGFILSLLATLLTVSYSIKLIYWTFFSTTYFGLKINLMNIHRITLLEKIVLFCLSIFSIFIGFVMRDHFIGLGSNYLTPSLLYSNIYNDSEFLSLFYKIIILLVLVVGLIIACIISFYWSIFYRKALLELDNWFILISCSKFLICKWYFDMVVNQYIANIVLDFGYRSFWVWDKWILEQGRISYLKKLF